MQRLLTTLALLLSVATALPAEQIFILLEGGCHNRVRYEKAVAGQPRTDYYAYHMAGTDGSKLMLETGMEDNTIQNFIPQGTIVCGDARLDERLLEKMGRANTTIYILRPAMLGQYYLNPVVAASVMRVEGSKITYRSNLTGLRMDLNDVVLGQDVTYQNPSASVILDLLAEGPCSGTFVFQQIDGDPRAPYPTITLGLNPELGLVERRLGSDGVRTSGGAIRARSVDGVAVHEFLANNCEKLRAGVSVQPNATPESAALIYQSPAPNEQSVAPRAAAPTTYGAAPAPVTLPAPTATTARALPTPQAGPTPPSVMTIKTHTVVRGETLYGISRRYATTVDALRAQNGLRGSLILPGQALIVSRSGGTGETTTTVVTNQTVPSVPAPSTYQSTATPPAGPAASPAAGTSATPPRRLHRVEPGETVASLALRSGYTETRFRAINHLEPNDYLVPGQTIITDHCDCPPPPAGKGAGPVTYGGSTTGRPIASPTVRNSAPATNLASKGSAPTSAPLRTDSYDQPAPAFQLTPSTVLPGSTGAGQNDPSAAPDLYGGPARTMGQLEGRVANSGTPVARRVYGASVRASDPFLGTALGKDGGSPPPPAPATAPNRDRQTHVVQEGESLFIIAQRYGVTTDKIRQINGLRANEVPVPYQKLYVE